MPEPYLSSILSFAHKLEETNQLSEAAVGKGESKKVDKEVRTDKILWLDGFENEEVQWLRDIYEGLQNMLRENFFLPVKRYEFHLTKYEKGSFYRLHQDTHTEKPGRLVSCVLYLNTCPEGEGGELVLYDHEVRPIKIRPERGKIVVFDSALEHKVEKTNVDRWSVTGWLRSDIHPGIRLY
jgi:SM-20-related protein